MQGYLLNKAARMVMLLILALFILAAPVQADVTYDFTATIKEPAYRTSFFLQYTDRDGDTHFSLDELVSGSFTGWTSYGPGHFFDIIRHVPGTSPDTPLTDGDTTDWIFWSSGSSYVQPIHPNYWTYSQSTAAPIPPSALLLGGGLITLLWARRKIRS
jgi:hypothetical protein